MEEGRKPWRQTTATTFVPQRLEGLTWETQFLRPHPATTQGNLIFKGEELRAIVDLEFAGDGCYLEDLAYAISNLCVRTSVKEERLSKRTDLMLDEYQRHRPLAFAEEAALYYAVGIKHVATVSYQLTWHTGTVAGLDAFRWMEHLALQCDWLASRAKHVRWG
jgi:Ser/Thr protein kinase RdoA (MazF antagonist)